MEPADIPAKNIVSKAWAVIVFTIHPAMAVTALELACQNLIILPDCRDAYYMAGDSPAKSFINATEELQSLDEGSEKQNDWRSLLFELSPTVRTAA